MWSEHKKGSQSKKCVFLKIFRQKTKFYAFFRNSAVGFCSMIARFGSGVSSYIAILSDVTLSIVPMIIFAVFSLFAGVLVLLLPETRDQPLPDSDFAIDRHTVGERS